MSDSGGETALLLPTPPLPAAAALSDEQRAFLDECETEFAYRFSEDDAEFVRQRKEGTPEPPVMVPWFSRRPWQERGGWRGGRGGGGRGGGRDFRDDRDRSGGRGGGGGGGYHDRDRSAVRDDRDRRDYRDDRDRGRDHRDDRDRGRDHRDDRDRGRDQRDDRDRGRDQRDDRRGGRQGGQYSGGAGGERRPFY